MRLVRIPLGRNFLERDRVRVKIETEDGAIGDLAEVFAPDGRARYGRVEEVEFRAVELPRHWWWPRRRRVSKRRVRVRFERRPNPSQ